MAKKKAKTTEELIRKQADIIMERLAYWLKILQEGCSDPSWSDGVNMNLLRNHIIYSKQNIAELAAGDNTRYPEEFYLETPPYIDQNFFAVPTSERAVRIRSVFAWKIHNRETPVSEKELKRFCERIKQNQLNLF